MGCFLGCFGGEEDLKRRKRWTNRAGPKAQRNRVQNVQQEIVTKTAEQTLTETPPTNLVSELQNKPTAEEKLSPSPSPRKRVTFNSIITTHEHVSIHESINSLPEECNQRDNLDSLKTTSLSNSPSDDDRLIISSVGSYPPNHRYHNARESDDEYEEYDDSDLDDFDDSDDRDDCDYESFLPSSVESTTENQSARAIDEELESCEDKSDDINSVLKPIENITQWKAAKSEGAHLFKSKSDQAKGENQEIAVDASLSNWLVSPQKTRSFEDRPLLLGTVGAHWNRSVLL